ncbi:MAG: YbaB/EbfC family nucleoid-associated protein [Fastidiosipilaceae bacterium]|jgi:DNA-binding YbaB/EbfC family protein|nr:YbaB/EbfC family nucleoid-associated protein [Clostridiaceae bacterium]
MAKGRRGGFPGGNRFGGGGGNLNQLMKQAQKMQEEMAKAQEEIANLEVEGSSGGGMVQVKINGDHRIIELNIEPEAVDPDDVDMLEDMVIAAINDAMNKLDKASEERMGSVTGGLPGMPGMGF